MAKTTAKDKDSGSRKPDRDRGDKPAKKPGSKAAQAAPAQPGVKDQVEGWTTSASRYLKAVRAEMKRITWPSRDQLRAYTIVVLLTLIFVTFYLWVCDVGFTWLFKKLVGQ
ncbi:MAG: preprotein translocase subunit SecE [Candidatus Xenobia bacterium]